MGLFVRLWVDVVIFSALCPYRGAYWCNIGIYSRYEGMLYPYPPPILKRGNLGCLSKKFFYFFIFPVGVVSSFAGFFRVKGSKIEYFLDVGVVIGWRNAKFGYF